MMSKSQNRTVDKHIIWSDMNLNPDDWRDSYKDFLEINEIDGNPNDEHGLYEYMVETNGEYLSDERENLNVQLAQPIIVIGDIGRWNGRVMGYKMIDSGNIKDCLYSDTDMTEWYVDRYGDLRADAVHHDGTNHYLYRVFKDKGSKTFIILDPYEYTKKDGTIGIDFNLKRVLDVSQTNGKRPAAPTANRDPRKLVAVMLDSAPINIESTSELPYPDMGAFYKNEDQTLYVKRDIGDSVALCQCVAQELGHAELSMNSEVYSRRDMGFQAVCIGYMLCKKYGVDTQNFAIDRIPDELKNKEPKDIKAELGKTQKAFKEITARVSDELYRQRAERSKEQER